MKTKCQYLRCSSLWLPISTDISSPPPHQLLGFVSLPSPTCQLAFLDLRFFGCKHSQYSRKVQHKKIHKHWLTPAVCQELLGPGNGNLNRLSHCLWEDQHISKQNTLQCSASYNRRRAEWCEIKWCWIYWHSLGRLHRIGDSARKDPL